jgi:hypothetical protein
VHERGPYRQPQHDRRTAFLERLRHAVLRWPERVNPQELRSLERQAGKLPPEDRFDVVSRPFVDLTYGGFLAQQYAGSLLLKLQPTCARPVMDVLLELLPNWNRSIEELPHYLEQFFGRDSVLTALDEIDRRGALDAVLTTAVRYWLRDWFRASFKEGSDAG